MPETDASRYTTFLPIARIDVGRREVWAIATSEDLVDKARAGNGVITFEASKRGMERMQTNAARVGATGGIVRERWHDDGRDVGRVIAWAPDEDTRQIAVGMKISRGADDTWEKIIDGTFVGVSVGGHILESHQEAMTLSKGVQRVMPKVTDVEYDEIILTSSPSDPNAVITAIYRTADGVLGVVGQPEGDDLDVARAWSEKARAAAIAARKAKAGTKTTDQKVASKGSHPFTKNNFVGKVGDKFVAYVDGKKIAEGTDQHEIEGKFNDAGGHDKIKAERAGSSAKAKATKAANTAAGKPRKGATVTIKGRGGVEIHGKVATTPNKDGTFDVKTDAGDTIEADIDSIKRISGPKKGDKVEEDGTPEGAGTTTTATTEPGADETRVERTEVEWSAMYDEVATAMSMPRSTIGRLNHETILGFYDRLNLKDEEADEVARAEADKAKAGDEGAGAGGDEDGKKGEDEDADDKVERTGALADLLAALDDPEEEAPEKVQRDGEESPAEEMTDAQIAGQAIALIDKLIAREAAELEAGSTLDACDVQSLLWIRDSLKSFAIGELMETISIARQTAEDLKVLRDETTLLAAKVVARTNTMRTEVTALNERVERTSNVATTEDLEKVVLRVKALEDTEVPGPATHGPNGLDARLHDANQTPESARSLLELIKRDASPMARQEIAALEQREAIKAAQQRPLGAAPKASRD